MSNINITIYNSKSSQEAAERAEVAAEKAEGFATGSGRVRAILPGALPAGPTGKTRYMEVTAVGTWTYGGNPVGSNAEGYRTTFWWTGDTWVDNGNVRVKGDLPEGTDTLQEEEIPKGKAVIKYAPSHEDVGVISYQVGQNIIEKYSNGSNTDTSLFDIDKYYNKTTGVISTGSDFIASKIKEPIIGGYSYDYKFRLYGAAGVVFFDKNGSVIVSISTSNSGWTDLTGIVDLPASVVSMGLTFGKGLALNQWFLRAKATITVKTENVFMLSGSGVKKTEVASNISPAGTSVINEEAVRKYAPSFDNIGLYLFKAGDNILGKYSNALITDTALFVLDTFYDKRYGTKAASSGYLTEKERIPVKGGKEYDYKFYLSGFTGVCFFDASGIMVTEISTNNTSTTVLEGTIILPNSVVSMGVSFYKGQSVLPLLFFKPKEDISIVSDKVFIPKGSMPDSTKFLSKNMGISMHLGDSVTEFGTYPDTISAQLGYSTLNCGVGGTRMASYSTANYGDLSFYKIAEAINTGDFTAVNLALDNLIYNAENVAPIDTNKANRLRRTKANLNNTDYSTVEFVSTFFGTNDFTGSVDIGSVDRTNKDTNTLVGALNYGIEKILSAYPNIKIVVITPTHRYIGSNVATGTSTDEYVNGDGNSMADFANAIEQMSNLNHLPCKNMIKSGLFNKYNHLTYFNDVVHPNTKGYTLIGKILSAFVKSNLF